MGLLNSHQILSGARRPGTIKTYVTALVKERPEPTIAVDTLTLAGGVIEFDGRDWSLDALEFDISGAAPFLKANTEYVVAAVPAYLEPLSKVDAETNPLYAGKGINYYVSQDVTSKEFYATHFMPSEVEASVIPYGGWNALQKKAFTIGLEPAEKLVFDRYSSELEKLADPRFTGRLVPIAGVEFMLVEIYPQDNSSSPDKSITMTKGEFEFFLAGQGFVPSEMLRPTTPYTITDPLLKTGTFYTDTTATTGLPGVAPGAKMYRLATVNLYASALDAESNINPFPVAGANDNDLAEAYAFVTAATPDGLGWTNVFAVAYEYFMPSYMALGHTGYECGITRFITKEQVRSFGRVNPVYLEDQLKSFRVPNAGEARSALMWYADPASLFIIKTGDCTPTTVEIDATYGYKVVRDDEIGGR
jgi:hypothetical protein